MRKILLGLFMAVAAVSLYAGGGFFRDRSDMINLSVTDAGDSARVTTFTPRVYDSFVYEDSFSYQYDTGLYVSVNWASPLQAMIITPTLDQASSVYHCSTGFATDTLGFDLDPAVNITTVALLCDTLVYLFNNTTNLKDSVLAEDSTAYVKLISKFSTVALTARWKVEHAVVGGTGTIDTSSAVEQATIAMICDSMAAAINAEDSLSAHMSASNSGDTLYSVVATDPGVLFFAAVFGDDGGGLVADSAQDTLTTQDNVTSNSTLTDTIELDYLIYQDKAINSIWGEFIIEPSYLATQGIGLADSAWVQLVTTMSNKTRVLAADTSASLGKIPCTLAVAITNSVAGRDTLFWPGLSLHIFIADTASDTTATVPYRVRSLYQIKDDE